MERIADGLEGSIVSKERAETGARARRRAGPTCRERVARTAAATGVFIGLDGNPGQWKTAGLRVSP